MMSITFIVPVADQEIYRNNFLASPMFAGKHPHQVLAQNGFRCSGEAYNDGLDKAENDLIVCAHQDVVLPTNWDEKFTATIRQLVGSRWAPIGVVGCIGIKSDGRAAGHIYRHDREFFPAPELPAEIETLDEMLISFRRSSGLRFDSNLPSFHFYAVDMCLQARSNGCSNMAVDVPCFHQGKNRNGKPRAFFASRRYMAKKWKHLLPVQTLSGTLSNELESYPQQEVRKAILRLLGKKTRHWWEDLPTIDPHVLLRG